MASRLLKDAAALVVAFLIGASFVQYHYKTHFDPHIVWDGFTLPGFDAHVYVAMAEEPRFFTVGPWGYRLLLPGLIGSLLPPRLIVPGFEWAAWISIVMASGLLFIYLRIRGATLRAALIAVALTMATPSVSAVFANPFLVEPFALALLLVALIAIEGEASPWVIAATLLLLSLTKEIWVFLLPLILLRERARGFGPALARTLALAAPALWVALLTRLVWSPQPGPQTVGGDSLAALSVIGGSVGVFAVDFLLGGLAIVGLLALCRTEARDYLAEHALTLVPLLTLPLLAATFTGEGAANSFFADDVKRLLIYVLPFVAALAVHLDPDHAQRRLLRGTPLSATAAKVLLLVLAVAPLGLDRYSRMDLTTSRDGPYVLGAVRESLRTARRLERGDTVTFDPSERKFAWGVSPPNDLSKLRFFLRQGFGPLAHYGIHDIKMREPSATMIVPLIEVRPLKVTLHMDARTSAWITFLVGGVRVGEALVGPQAVAVTLDVSRERLFRGDNPVELRCENAATALPRILRIELRQ